MIDIDKVTKGKLGEMCDALIIDNNYLRGELNAARARLATQGEGVSGGDAVASPAPPRDSL